MLQTLVHSQPQQPQQPQQQEEEQEPTDAMEDDVEDDEEAMIDAIAVECCGFCCSELPFVASGGMDGQLKVWDLNTGNLRVACAHGAAVVSLKWHATMPIVTTACLDKQVRLWDARSGNLIIALTGHVNDVTFVTSLTFKLAQEQHQEQEVAQRQLEGIVSVSDDTTVRFFATDLIKIV